MKLAILLLLALLVATVRPHQAAAAVATVVGDAYTNSAAPNSNYRTATSLLIKGPPASAVVANVYAQFDLSSLPPGTTGADVAKATLSVAVNTVSVAGSFDVVRVTGVWTEAGIKASAAPTLGGTPEVSGVAVALADKRSFKTIDVTQLVKDWLDNVLPNNGIALVPSNAGLSIKVDSKESTATSHPMQLDIELGRVSTFSGNLSGDVTGTQAATHVGKLNGSTLGSLAAATSGQALAFNGATWSPSSMVNSLAAGSGLSASGSTGNVTMNVPNGGISNSMLVSSSVTVTAGSGLSGGGTVALGSSTTLTSTGVLSVGASAPLASSGGQSPSVSLTGTVPLANGGTGASTAAGALGNLGAAARGANSDITALSGITANISLPDSTSAAVGNILKGGGVFIHNFPAFNNQNTFIGGNSGNFSMTGQINTGLGYGTLAADTSGGFNTAVGVGALDGNTAGNFNNALGRLALSQNTSGSSNIAVGDFAGGNLTTGSNNIDIGSPGIAAESSTIRIGSTGTQSATYIAGISGATSSNGAAVFISSSGQLGTATGSSNAALGDSALQHNTSGFNNVAVGQSALNQNTTGTSSTALGYVALSSNVTGSFNTAIGFEALELTTGGHNTAVGAQALTGNTTGDSNTAVGINAAQANTTAFYNTAVGNNALAGNSTGWRNIALGQAAGALLTTGDDNIDIGNQGVAGESGRIRIGTVGTHGSTFIAGINGATSSGGVAVFVNSSGQLGTTTSSARFKNDIQDMGDSTSALMQLRPVRFRYKKDIDPSGLEQYGLVAEEVAKVYPDLVVYDDHGQPQTVRYHFVNAMLLNEVQKQARQIAAQRRQLDEQRQHVSEQARAIKAQAQQIATLNSETRQANAQAQQLEALTARLARLEATVSAPRHAPAVEASYRNGPGL